MTGEYTVSKLKFVYKYTVSKHRSGIACGDDRTGKAKIRTGAAWRDGDDIPEKLKFAPERHCVTGTIVAENNIFSTFFAGQPCGFRFAHRLS